jgi:hypothetical protein
MPGATTNPLILSNVQPTDAGAYSVVVSGYGSVVSSNAILTVLYAPVITMQPQGTVGYWGMSAHFSVAAEGVPEPCYLWYKDGFPIPWATNASISLANLDFTYAGSYWVVVSNCVGTVTSDSALLVINPAGVSLGFHPFLVITGVVGRTYGIQYIPDVSPTNSWLSLTNLTLTQPVQKWIDTTVDALPGGSRRFYRVIAIPSP